MSLACSAEEQRLCSWFTRARELMVLWRMRVRVRNELIMLSDGDLHDIGWTRAEVKAEHRKPFWRT
jgi:uncharacterized protein YjiS (DUF1127 family)